MADRVRITLVGSPIGCKPAHRATVRSLGLRRIGQAVEREDGPQLWGAVRKVAHLIRVERVAAPRARGRRSTKQGG